MTRSSGILLHPTSLPGPFGIGDFGGEARAFVDFLAAAGQRLWQVLPLGATGYGDSPYQALSAFAGNTSLISPDSLVADGLLVPADLEGAPSFSSDAVDFAPVQTFKRALLRTAFDNFKNGASGLQSDFAEFCESSARWLDDYALFCALKDEHGGVQWTEWEDPLRNREAAAIEDARRKLSEQITAQKFFQFLFFRQWRALREYAHQRGIQVIGDLPIFVAHDSADVWANRESFKLDEHGAPTTVAGVPPDYFSETGQLWGNPLYDWERLKADGFKWWIERVRFAFQLFDYLRIDHFRGFAACWEVLAGEPTAQCGQWVAVPGHELFTALAAELGDLPIIAENLGVITPDVESLRSEFGFPGMRVLQFAFGSDASNEHLPHNYPRDAVAYTGTHDNDTTVGWFASLNGEAEREFCLKYLRGDGQEIHWDFIRAALASVAETAIIPLPDVLGLGSEARMNHPASSSGNWSWRFNTAMLTSDLAGRLKEMTRLYGRCPDDATQS